MRTAILEGRGREPALTQWLEAAGHSVEPFTDLDALLRVLPSQSFDVLLLGDWPAMSGPDLIRQVRRSSPITILFVSLRHQEQDIITALRAGADDYLIKPLRRLELLARLESTTRHLREQVKPRQFEVHGLRVDCENRTILRNHVPVRLTGKDFDLSALLLRNVGRLLYRSYIEQAVWRRELGRTSRTLDTHICRLRKILSLTPYNGWRLTPVYRHGYRLERCGSTRPAAGIPALRKAPSTTQPHDLGSIRD